VIGQNAKFSITPEVNRYKLNVVYVIELDERIPLKQESLRCGCCEESNVRKRYFFGEDRCLFHAGVTLGKAGWIPYLDARGLEEEHSLFVQLAFTESQSFL
jgi:hypothetical protein